MNNFNNICLRAVASKWKGWDSNLAFGVHAPSHQVSLPGVSLETRPHLAPQRKSACVDL